MSQPRQPCSWGPLDTDLNKAESSCANSSRSNPGQSASSRLLNDKKRVARFDRARTTRGIDWTIAWRLVDFVWKKKKRQLRDSLEATMECTVVRLRGERNEDQRGICGGLEDGDGFGELVLKFRDSGKQRNYFSRRDRCLRMKRRGGINRAGASNVGFSNLWQ